MPKQLATQECEYVRNMPTQAVELQNGTEGSGEVHARTPGGPTVTGKGKLFLASRKVAIAAELFDEGNSYGVCEQGSDPRSASYRGFANQLAPLRMTVKEPEPPSQFVITGGVYVTMQNSCQAQLTLGCQGNDSIVVGFIGGNNGDLSSGTLTVQGPTINDLNTEGECTSANGVACLPYLPFNSSFMFNYQLAVVPYGPNPAFDFWHVTIPGDRTTCAIGSTGTVCQTGPGQSGSEALYTSPICRQTIFGGNRMLCTAVGAFIFVEVPNNWRDDIDMDGNYNGVPVLN